MAKTPGEQILEDIIAKSTNPAAVAKAKAELGAYSEGKAAIGAAARESVVSKMMVAELKGINSRLDRLTSVLIQSETNTQEMFARLQEQNSLFLTNLAENAREAARGQGAGGVLYGANDNQPGRKKDGGGFLDALLSMLGLGGMTKGLTSMLPLTLGMLGGKLLKGGLIATIATFLFSRLDEGLKEQLDQFGLNEFTVAAGTALLSLLPLTAKWLGPIAGAGLGAMIMTKIFNSLDENLREQLENLGIDSMDFAIAGAVGGGAAAWGAGKLIKGAMSNVKNPFTAAKSIIGRGLASFAIGFAGEVASNIAENITGDDSVSKYIDDIALGAQLGMWFGPGGALIGAALGFMKRLGQDILTYFENEKQKALDRIRQEGATELNTEMTQNISMAPSNPKNPLEMTWLEEVSNIPQGDVQGQIMALQGAAATARDYRNEFVNRDAMNWTEEQTAAYNANVNALKILSEKDPRFKPVYESIVGSGLAVGQAEQGQFVYDFDKTAYEQAIKEYQQGPKQVQGSANFMMPDLGTWGSLTTPSSDAQSITVPPNITDYLARIPGGAQGTTTVPIVVQNDNRNMSTTNVGGAGGGSSSGPGGPGWMLGSPFDNELIGSSSFSYAFSRSW